MKILSNKKYNAMVKTIEKQKRIIETQKAIIMDTTEFKTFVNIDFPNSHERSKTNTGAFNGVNDVNDILFN